MKKSLNITYGILILMTIVTALISNSKIVPNVALYLIMGITVFKFLLVTFQFMELKKANSFWKVSLITVLLGIVLLILIL